MNWLTYVKERFPLPVYFLLVGGIALSGNFLVRPSFEAVPTLVAFVGILAFFFVLRLMDELKDYDKDVVVHPNRPLPRGLLEKDKIGSIILILVIGLAAFAGLAGSLTSNVAGVNFLVVVIWLWLMYKEFYLGSWLSDRPLLYAITHQLILLPVCSFAVAVHEPGLQTHPETWAFGFAVLGSFFSYEVCRKLDPKAHPLLKTYLQVYGIEKTAIIVVVVNLVAAYGAQALRLGAWMWWAEALVIASVFVLFKDPSRHKLTETAATLSLLFHIWGVTFARIAKWISGS